LSKKIRPIFLQNLWTHIRIFSVTSWRSSTIGQHYTQLQFFDVGKSKKEKSAKRGKTRERGLHGRVFVIFSIFCHFLRFFCSLRLHCEKCKSTLIVRLLISVFHCKSILSSISCRLIVQVNNSLMFSNRLFIQIG